MSAAEILDHLKQHGVRIERHGTRLRLSARTAPPADLLRRLQAAKPDVLAVLPDVDAPTPRAVVRFQLPGCPANTWATAIGGKSRAEIVAEILRKWPDAEVLP